jgi:V8-like Glu-specific endopeptidase
MRPGPAAARRLLVAGAVGALLASRAAATTGTAGLPAPGARGILPRAIFGDDDRHEVHAVADADHRRATEAVALLADNYTLDCDASGTRCDLETEALVERGVCPDEPFAGQPAGGFCTGFLIAPDLLATAGHCVNEARCPFTAAVFGFAITEPGGAAPETGLEAYRCAEVVESVLRTGFEDDGRFQDGADYAVIRLDRPVTGRRPLILRRTPPVAVGEPLVLVGHPFGLPLKVADGAEVRSTAGTFFQANLDHAAGSSGSPVLDRETLAVVGILVRGPLDLVVDRERRCRRPARFGDAEGQLAFFAQATHAAMVPDTPSCVPFDSASGAFVDGEACLTRATTASCLRVGVLFDDESVHSPFCRECYGELGPTRRVRKLADRALRLIRVPRRREQVEKARLACERAAGRLEQVHGGGRVSEECVAALRSVIDEALALIRVVLD